MVVGWERGCGREKERYSGGGEGRMGRKAIQTPAGAVEEWTPLRGHHLVTVTGPRARRLIRPWAFRLSCEIPAPMGQRHISYVLLRHPARRTASLAGADRLAVEKGGYRWQRRGMAMLMTEIFIPRSAGASHHAQRRTLQKGAEQASASPRPRKIPLNRKTNLKQTSLHGLTAEDRSETTPPRPSLALLLSPCGSDGTQTQVQSARHIPKEQEDGKRDRENVCERRDSIHEIDL